MEKKNNPRSDAAELRRRAEERLREMQKSKKQEAGVTGGMEEAQRLIQELQIHQIELEMQNEELRKSRAEVESGLELYTDLYDFAPAGYFSLDREGLIRRTNLTSASLLGQERARMVNRRIGQFVSEADRPTFNSFLQKVFAKQGVASGRVSCEVALSGRQDRTSALESAGSQQNDGATRRYVYIEGTVTEDRQECRAVMTDVTERKSQEDERELTARLVVLINTPAAFRELMSDLTASLQGWSGCEAVGIRLRDGNDYPYYETRGFPPLFVQAESHLCAHGPDGKILRDVMGDPILECMCGNILCGRFDPSKPFFTAQGSFWTNSTTALLASTTEDDRQSRTRNRCNSEGYESVVLIPLRVEDQVFGLLQFNDHRPNRFAPDMIAHFERMADNLAIALSRRQVVGELALSAREWQNTFDATNDAIWLLDQDQRVLRSNKIAEQFFHRPVGEMIGKKCCEIIHGTTEPIPGCPVIRARKSLHRESMELQVENRWFDITVDPILDNGNQYCGSVHIIYDISNRKKSEEKLQETLENLKSAVGTTIQILVSTVEARDPYTSGHQLRSADLARAIAAEMGLPEEKIDAIRMTASIHDIGKISIPAEILSKPTKLSDIEYSLIKDHSHRGYEMLKNVESSWPLAEIVYQHHERMDGSGYPRNLKGDEICIEARILSVADVVEAMASHRPYRASLGIDAALAEIEKNSGVFYDNAVADACLRLFREKGFQFEGS